MVLVPAPQMVVFDLSGTLTSYRSSVSSFMAANAEGTCMRVLRAGNSLLTAVRDIKRCVSRRPVISGETKRKVLSYVANLREDAACSLQGLREQGVRTVLLSNDPRYATGERFLKHFGLGPYFDDVIFPEDVNGARKPDPAGLLLALRNRRETVWVVGDMPQDIIVAEKVRYLTGREIVPIALGEKSLAAQYVRREGLSYPIVGSLSALRDLARGNDIRQDFAPVV